MAGFTFARGPNRVGPLGLFQPIADGIKLLTKLFISPSQADRVAVLPGADGDPDASTRGLGRDPLWHPAIVLSDINAGLLYVMAITSVGVDGVIIAGWASNSKYAFLGAMRAAEQMVSYEIGMGFVLVTVLMVAGTLNLTADRSGTEHRVLRLGMGLNFLSWNWLPLLPLFVIYVVSSVAETNRHPFDVVEAVSEIVAGQTGRVLRHELRDFLPRSIREHDFAVDGSDDHVSWRLGSAGRSRAIAWLRSAALDQLAVRLVLAFREVFFVVSLFIWFRASFPRYRYDQIMRLGWKIFIPLTLVWLVVIAVWMQTPWNIWST